MRGINDQCLMFLSDPNYTDRDSDNEGSTNRVGDISGEQPINEAINSHVDF